MDLVRPELVPTPAMDREAMLAQQRRVRAAATFTPGFDPDRYSLDDVSVLGVDQAFTDDRVVSCAVVMTGDEIVDASIASRPIDAPYIPGFLSFREAPAAVAACQALSVVPDLLLIDGNGRLHYREAGLATHIGVVFDAPTVGIAKRLLCGDLAESPEPPYAVGTRVPIVADARVDAPAGTVLGYAVQTRQWDRPDRSINPIFASPGHLVDARGAASIAIAACRGYKLPEPIRQADRRAGEATTKGDSDR